MSDPTAGQVTREAPIRLGHMRFLRRDLYATVFLLIIATIISSATLGDGPWGLLGTLILQTATLWVALLASDVGSRTKKYALAVCGLVVFAVTVAVLTGNLQPAKIASGVTMLFLVGFTPIVIVRQLMRHPVINFTTVNGAADIYLLFGLFFATIYRLMGTLAGHSGGAALQAFFYSSRPLTQSDFIYYSYVTLTTVGFGDVTAANSLGRMLSVTEALIGQLYLVTVVALLVGNFGRSRTATGPNGSESVLDPDD